MDLVMMFKVLVLQALYGLADEQTEFQVRDRLSFMCFLGLDRGWADSGRPHDLAVPRAPDQGQGGRRFVRPLRGLISATADTSRWVDDRRLDHRGASAAQHGRGEGRPQGRPGPGGLGGEPGESRQKDRDGRWTLKRGRRKRKPDGTLMMEIATPVYGYKSHVGVDRHHRFIRTWSVTDAARYDGRELAELLDREQYWFIGLADTAIDPRRTKSASPRRGWSRASTSASRPASRCPSRNSARTPPARGNAPASSMSSPTRSTAWGCSSAPSASPERAPKSASPTSCATCAGFCSGESNGRASVAKSTPAPRARDAERARKEKPTQSPAAKILQPNLKRWKIENPLAVPPHLRCLVGRVHDDRLAADREFLMGPCSRRLRRHRSVARDELEAEEGSDRVTGGAGDDQFTFNARSFQPY